MRSKHVVWASLVLLGCAEAGSDECEVNGMACEQTNVADAAPSTAVVGAVFDAAADAAERDASAADAAVDASVPDARVVSCEDPRGEAPHVNGLDSSPSCQALAKKYLYVSPPHGMSTAGDGTPMSPMHLLSEAIQRAEKEGRDIVAVAGDYREGSASLNVSGVRIFGGYLEADWHRADELSAWFTGAAGVWFDGISKPSRLDQISIKSKDGAPNGWEVSEHNSVALRIGGRSGAVPTFEIVNSQIEAGDAAEGRGTGRTGAPGRKTSGLDMRSVYEPGVPAEAGGYGGGASVGLYASAVRVVLRGSAVSSGAGGAGGEGNPRGAAGPSIGVVLANATIEQADSSVSHGQGGTNPDAGVNTPVGRVMDVVKEADWK
jgi:hypothetical protein